jgi:hypothetical protein
VDQDGRVCDQDERGREQDEEEVSIIDPAMALPRTVSGDLLINLNASPIPPPPLSYPLHNQSCDSLINPSLDMLGADTLVPGKSTDVPPQLDTTNHKLEPSSQYVSQELF